MIRQMLWLLALLVSVTACNGKTSDELYSEGVRLLGAGKPGSAIVLFRYALEKNQNFPEARYQLAQAYVREGKFEHAEKELQKVRLLNPSHPEIHCDLATVYNHLRKPDLAIQHAREYLNSNPDSLVALEALGCAYRIKNMPHDADTILLQVLQKDPSRQSARVELAELYLEGKQFERASDLLEEVLKANPSYDHALHLLADIKVMRGRNAEALALYRKLGSRNPSECLAPYKAGLLHLETGQTTMTDTIAADLVKRFPTRPEGYRLKGITAYRQKQYSEAITSLQYANKIQSTETGHFFLGLSLHAHGDLESAINQFRYILDRNPRLSQARLLIGVILLQQKRLDDAVAELVRLVENDAENPQAHYILGTVYLAKGMYEEGIGELDTATRLEPKLVDAYLKKGVLNLNRGNPGGAEANLRTAVQAAPELSGTRLILSAFHEFRNNRPKALSILREGLSKTGEDTVLYCAMARLMFEAGDTDDAVRTLSRARENDPAAVAPGFMLAAHYTVQNDRDRALAEYSGILKQEPRNVKAMLRTATLMESGRRDSDAYAWYLKAMETGDPAGFLAVARYHEKRGSTDRALAILAAADKTHGRSVEIIDETVRLRMKKRLFKEALQACDTLEAVSPARASYTRALVHIAMNDLSKALKEAERAIIYDPGSARGYQLMATVCRKQNNPCRVVELLQKAIKADSNNSRLIMALATVYATFGNHAMAVRTCSDLLRRFPGYAPAYVTLGTVLEQQGRKQEAVEKFRRAVSLSATYAAAINNLSFLYADGFGPVTESLRLAEKAIALDPENPSVMDTLGYALLKNGRHDEARSYLEKAAALVPDSPVFNYHLGLALQAAGHREQAAASLRKAILAGSFDGMHTARELLSQRN